MAPVRPRFSVVAAVYDVEPYLPAFIASIERQAVDPSSLEVIAVDDGSSDGSLRLLEAWRDRSAIPVTVLTQRNAGQGAARNAGLERATGEWVTFTDPDDVLEDGYLAAIGAFAAGNPGIDVLSGKRMTLDESAGEVRDVHPRRWQFVDGSRVADLDVEPNVFPVSASTAFFRGDRLRSSGLRYDPELRPHFEDQHFAARFLLALDRPLVGLVAGARYDYRVRLANDSTLQRIHADQRSYTTVFERGYLDLVRRSLARDGTVAPWIQQLLLYEITRRYLREADAYPGRLDVPAALEPRFRDLFGELARALDEAQVYAHAGSPVDPVWAELLVHGYRDERWVPAAVDRTDVDRVMRLQRLSYRFRGDPPVERLEVDGRPAAPAFAKTRAVRYFGRTELEERILWVPAAGRVALSLDGVAAGIGPPRAPVQALDARRASRRPPTRAATLRRRLEREQLAASLTRLLARTVGRRWFRGAWVLVDGPQDADGEAEALFAWLRREHPERNAWYAIARGTPRSERLLRAGGRRVVTYGDLRWRLLMLNAGWLLSSDLDDELVRPRAIRRLTRRPPWRFGFLGGIDAAVDGEDPAVRLNPHRIDLLPVRSDAELGAVAADGTRSRLTHKEARVTGLPGDDPDAPGRLVAVLDELGRPWAPPLADGAA